MLSTKLAESFSVLVISKASRGVSSFNGSSSRIAFLLVLPEDGDKQVDEHDGSDEHVDKEQRHDEPRLPRTTSDVAVTEIESAVVAAAFGFACNQHQAHEHDTVTVHDLMHNGQHSTQCAN